MPAKTTRKATTDTRRSGKAKGKAKKGKAGRREPKRTARIYLSADDLDLLDEMIADSGMHDVESCCASDLATFIFNSGAAEDRAEALVAVLPVAARLYRRLEANPRWKRHKLDVLFGRTRTANDSPLTK